MSYKKGLDKLFERPGESIDVPKGKKNTRFSVPEHFKTADTFKHDVEKSDWITIKDIKVPSLDFITSAIGQYDLFSSYLPKHRLLANGLTKIFLNCKNTDELLSIAAYCHDRINLYLFSYSLNVAILNRPDTKDFQLRGLHAYFPDKFVNGKVFQNAREEVAVVPEGSRVSFEIYFNSILFSIFIFIRFQFIFGQI